jgi:hypothetical protein
MGKAYEWWLENLRKKPSDPHGVAYKRALYNLRHVVSEEFLESIPVSPEADTESKALYERLAALRQMMPDSFKELLGDAREELGLPREKKLKSVVERRREAGLVDEPIE